jgi:CRISPR-associated protein Cmr1
MDNRRLTVTLETVTPMFLGGAEQKPELRPPSIRGQLRYWLRAALGSVIGDQDTEALKDLKLAESEIFGNTEGTGSVGVRLRQSDLTHEKIAPLPHKDSPTRFDGFLAKQKFHLTLVQQHGTQTTWLSALGALLLMVSFGGLGRRSRRGWGTLQIVHASVDEANLNDNWLSLLRFKPDSADDWQAYLLNSYKASRYACQQLCKDLNIERGIAHRPAEFAILGESNPGQVYKTIYPRPEDAISEFGRREHNFGAGKEFGSADRPRWASPLWVRVFPVSIPNRGYVLSMALFESQSEVANYDRVKKFLEQWNTLLTEVRS